MNIQPENTASTSLFGATSQDMMCTPSQRKSRRRTETPTVKQESGRKSSYKKETMEDLESCPLQGLIVYVEIFSNKVNISETAYKQLEELGAQIEKRMNKKCNLVIWKDGSPRTLQRAKKYEIPVVNSLWLADCADNFKRADVSKYTPSKLDQEVALFSAAKTKKRKRFVLENLHSDTKADRKHSRSAVKRLSSLETHKTKLIKTKSITKQSSDKKVTIKLKRKDSKAKKREVTRSLSFDTNPKASKRGRPKSQRKLKKTQAPTVSKILFRSGSLHRRIIKVRNPDLGTLEELKVRNLSESGDEAASEKSYYSDRRKASPRGNLDIDAILAQREKARESSRIRDMILRYASYEYPIAVSTYNMVSDQDTNIEDGDLDFSVKSPMVGPFEHSENYESLPNLENNRTEIDFAQLQPTFCTGGDMLEEKDEEENEKGIEIEDEAVEAVEAVPLDKVVCESPAMDTLKPEGSHTFETPVTKAGTSMNKDSIEKAFSTPAKKSSDMKKLIDNIYSDFKGVEEVKEEITDSTMLMLRGRRPTREKVSAGRTLNYTLRSNSKEKLSISSKSSDVAVVSLLTTRQPRQKKSSIVSKGLNDSGLGRLKGKQLNTTPVQSRPQSLNKAIAMEEEKVSSEEIQAPKRRNVLFSNLKRTELSKMKDFCDKYGLNYLEDRINNAENIEILVAEKQEIPQNFKTAVVMAKGKAIVKREWIVNSIKKDKLLDFEYFLIPYNHDQRKSLLKNKKFYIDPEIEDMPINMIQVHDISRLITATAGIVSQDLKECDFCIRRKTTKKELLMPSQTKGVTLQWLIDSVLDGKMKDTNNSAYKII